MSQNVHIPFVKASEKSISLTAKLESPGIGFTDGTNLLVCGSIRRRRPTCGDIDVAVTTEIFEWQVNQNAIAELLTDPIIAKNGHLKGGFYQGIKVEFYVGPERGFGALTLFATGSPEFNIRCRVLANQNSYKLSQYGLFLLQQDWFHVKEGEAIISTTEAAILDALGIPECLDVLNRER